MGGRGGSSGSANGGADKGKYESRIGLSVSESERTITISEREDAMKGINKEMPKEKLDAYVASIYRNRFYKVEVGIPKYSAFSDRQSSYAQSVAEKKINRIVAKAKFNYESATQEQRQAFAKANGIKMTDKYLKNKFVNAQVKNSPAIKELTNKNTKAGTVIDKYK